MLKKLDVETIKLSDYPIEAQASIEYYKHRIKSGSKVEFRLNIQRNKKYLNIYEYDNTRWKYILVDKIEV